MGKLGLFMANFVALFVIGLWHGFSIGMILFGLYHGLLLGVYSVIETRGAPKSMSSRVLGILATYAVVSVGLVLFQMNDLGILGKVAEVGSMSGLVDLARFRTSLMSFDVYVLILVAIVLDYVCSLVEKIASLPYALSWVALSVMVCSVLVYGNFASREFIYMDF